MALAGNKEIYSVKICAWNMSFQPTVFKKRKQADKSKSVGMALTTDLLRRAYSDNYDHAVLVAGDGGYVPLIDEVKQLGKVVQSASLIPRG